MNVEAVLIHNDCTHKVWKSVCGKDYHSVYVFAQKMFLNAMDFWCILRIVPAIRGCKIQCKNFGVSRYLNENRYKVISGHDFTNAECTTLDW